MVRKSAILVYIIALLLLLVFATFATAATLTHALSGPSQPNSARRWFENLTVPQFDPTLGTLNSITFEMIGYVHGNAAFESIRRYPTYVLLGLSERLALFGPDSALITLVTPTVTVGERVRGYDGSTDFAGQSGRTYTGLFGSVTAPSVVLDASQVNPTVWVGTGNVSLKLGGNALSSKIAPRESGVFVDFETFGSADVFVTYSYVPTTVRDERPAIPEMGSLSLAVIGALIGTPLLRLRRRI